MRCPYCKADDDRVIDSRTSADGFAIRRRRVCRNCGRRYTTYERVENAPLRVVKKNGERVEFDRAKVMSGLSRAVEKRPVSMEQLDQLVDRVERQVVEAFDREVPTKIIGELVMQELQQLDQVAYVRFASVYRDFKDVGQFLDELRPMLESPGLESPGQRHGDGRSDARIQEGTSTREDGRDGGVVGEDAASRRAFGATDEREAWQGGGHGEKTG